MKNLLKISICLLLITLITYGCNEKKIAWISDKSGTSIPNFTIRLLSGQILKSSDISKGQTFVIIYVSPGCPFCRAFLTDIKNDISSFDNIVFYILTSENNGDMDRLAKEFKLNGLSFVVGCDVKNEYSRTFKITEIPYTAIFNKERKVMVDFSGLIKIDQLQKLIFNRP